MTTQIQIKKIGDEFFLPLSEEMLQKLGVQGGGKVDVFAAENEIVLRPLAAENLGARVDEIMDELLETRRSAYERLAEGA